MRVGIGYDSHELVSGRKMVLGGMTFGEDAGPAGHSDGDALLHAITDAIFGAIGEEDLGARYPDTDERYRNADSSLFLRDAVRAAVEKGFSVENVDCVLIIERPRVSGCREELIKSIERIMGVPPGRVNVKGKTAEGRGPEISSRIVEVHSVVLLSRGTSTEKERLT
ncbi:MAG: 2-C-methyl-D-erythritol 2,4-cyclodiphosphate synthase [Candidatus Omnitrophica bacterium]|nr:2-C-methyl-D-erythritol 2,4-cyclodiphosphate synthase [Candidatus Omnitrophota bacterium]